MKVIFCASQYQQWTEIRELENVPIPRIGEKVNIRGAFPNQSRRDFRGMVIDVCYDYENESVDVMIED